ncbi:MAG: AbrB family transcriptional regulator [Ignavibacteria bacterium GWB2_35_12]|nr:MAG: AbrB family transcriptional regulator [Ignavibacteria bacterium GWA2_35_8]OGU41290.1 MAG: AbrB family transcriptional regulator [Ignavibacteria bacterium GWB2_35_12]OGU94769.1 MAG: AbrB family transcriptional regulator [Ignavibacteria bacterium RIFOXYA2_FULL_35_10]OGV23935.1 MAG: AbrB family transcriptional regulator [Ignavibacteria bacterium RIFOXYC2_FULL_35_21]
MNSVIVSPKYQVVIPRQVRNSMGIKPGMKVQVIHYNNRIEIIPLQNLKKLRGRLKGIDTEIIRENDRL